MSRQSCDLESRIAKNNSKVRHRCYKCDREIIEPPSPQSNIYSYRAKKKDWICIDCFNANRSHGRPDSEKTIFDTLTLVGDTETTVNVFLGDKAVFRYGAFKIVSGLKSKDFKDGLFYDGKPIDEIRYFETQEAMNEFLSKFFLSGEHDLTRDRNVVFFHNSAFDYRIVFRKELGYKGTMKTVKPFSYDVVNTGKSNHQTHIQVLDSISYIPASLEKIMEDWHLSVHKVPFDYINEINKIKETNPDWRDSPEDTAKLRELKKKQDNLPIDVLKQRVTNDVEGLAQIVLKIYEECHGYGIKTVKLGGPSMAYEAWARSIRPELLLRIDPTMFYDLYIDLYKHSKNPFAGVDDETLAKCGITKYKVVPDRDKPKRVKKRSMEYPFLSWDKKKLLREHPQIFIELYGWKASRMSYDKALVYGKTEYRRPRHFEGKMGLAEQTGYGGRVEVFDRTRKYRYYMDENSLYGYVMKYYPLPIELLFEIDNPSADEVKRFLDAGYLIAADVIVNVPKHTKYPPFPKHSGGKLRFNVGRFPTYLCSPEFEKPEYFRMIEKFRSISVYRADFITRDFIGKIIGEREKAQERGDSATASAKKLIYTSLSGKFGEGVHRKLVPFENWLKEHDDDKNLIGRTEPMIFLEPDNVNSAILYNRADGQYVDYRTTDTSQYKRFMPIYSFITSCGRSILLEFIKEYEADYTDTDAGSITREQHERIREHDNEIQAQIELLTLANGVRQDINDYQGRLDELERQKIEGKCVGQVKMEAEGDSQYFRPKLYFMGNKTKIKGVGKNAKSANRERLEESRGGKLHVKGERMTTMRKSEDVILVAQDKDIKTRDDKRVPLEDGRTIAIEMGLLSLADWYDEDTDQVGVGEYCQVVCPYCFGIYDEDEGYDHIYYAGTDEEIGCKNYYDLRKEKCLYCLEVYDSGKKHECHSDSVPLLVSPTHKT